METNRTNSRYACSHPVSTAPCKVTRFSLRIESQKLFLSFLSLTIQFKITLDKAQHPSLFFVWSELDFLFTKWKWTRLFKRAHILPFELELANEKTKHLTCILFMCDIV
jgi:hypothetical protein